MRKRKKEDVFVEGYLLQNVTELTPGIDSTDDSVDVFSDDDPVTDKIIDNGTLSMTIRDKYGDLTLQSLVTGQDPGATGDKQFYYSAVSPVSVWTNIRNAANTEYTGSVLYNDWTPTPGLPTGGAGDKSSRTYTGQTKIPKEFNQPLSARLVVDSTPYFTWGSAAESDIPQVPGTSSVLAVRLLAMDSTNYAFEDITPTAGMVQWSASGTRWEVDFTAIEAALTSLTAGAVDQAYVIFLYDKTLGIYPTAGLPVPDERGT